MKYRSYCKNVLFLCASLVVLLALTACGTRHVSRDISPEGKAGEVIFPSQGKLVLKEGTFPNVADLRQIGPGITKDQLYDLIGHPHFREGLYGVREWDYLFHLREGDRVVTCQYKVIFDKQGHGRSFHWLPESCANADVLARGDTSGGSSALASGKRFDLSADALFAFGRSGLQDILPNGREEFAAVALQLKSSKAALVQVNGHTDRIGDDASNLALSQRRAETVRAFLIQQGVAAETTSAHGFGKTEPVKQCSDAQPRTDLVACLQPNRRVEIVATGLE